jgi:ribosome-associated protein
LKAAKPSSPAKSTRPRSPRPKAKAPSAKKPAPPPVDEVRSALQSCITALDDKKAASIRILDVRGISTITDYFLIVTGTSDPHLKALGRAAEEALDGLKLEYLSSGVSEKSGWAVVDAYDFIVHMFTDEVRRHYNLEGLWRDAAVIDPASLV